MRLKKKAYVKKYIKFKLFLLGEKLNKSNCTMGPTFDA